MNFQQKLEKIIKINNSLLCIGLDTDPDKIPGFLKSKKYPLFEFNKKIVNATHDLVCAYKPNSAFYEAEGEKGIKELWLTCQYILNKYPEIPIILDAKRGDIGNTNEGYIKYTYEYLGVDAITLSPYLGGEALMPFLKLKDKGAIILCKTSNAGSGEIQDLTSKKPLYKIVAEKAAHEWNSNNNCLLVVGATYPKILREIRKIVGEMTLLVPGIGSQGGDTEKTLKAGLNSGGKGLIINSSRGIIYAGAGREFAKIAREEALRLKEEINKHRFKIIGKI